MAFFIPQTHPPATQTTTQTRDLTGQRLLLNERTNDYHQVSERTLPHYRMNPYSGLEIGSLETIRQAVQYGLGLAFIPRIFITPPPAQTVVREIEEVKLSLPIGLVMLANEISPSRALEALLILFHKAL